MVLSRQASKTMKSGTYFGKVKHPLIVTTVTYCKLDHLSSSYVRVICHLTPMPSYNCYEEQFKRVRPCTDGIKQNITVDSSIESYAQSQQVQKEME